MKRSEKHKRGKGIVIVTGILIIGCLFFFGYRTINEQRMEAKGKETIKGFVDRLSKGKYQESLKYLSEDSLKSLDFSKQQVNEKYQNIYGSIGVHDIKIKNLKIKKNQFAYTAVLYTGLGKSLKQNYQGTFTKGNSLIEWAPNLIFFWNETDR